ncbi:MAG: transposase [Oscillospiraceae bacterium]|nr:transposase [Oscillospiraceae bacterium]
MRGIIKYKRTQSGAAYVKISRDRNGEYEPQIIEKYNRNADGMEKRTPAQFISLS